MSVARRPSAAQLLALMEMPGVGPARARAIAADSQLLKATLAEAADYVRRYDERIDNWSSAGIATVGWFHEDFPDPLRTVTSGPAVLWVRGRLPESWETAFAVVGTRKPSIEAGKAVTRFVRSIPAGQGIVVSGLARGVDAIAHRAALDAGAATVAVLAGGVDKPSPSENHDLAESILSAGGALISEQQPGAPTEARHLVSRNRIQTGLSRATVIGEMGLNGGTTHTARYAIEQGRPLFCLTSPEGPEAFGAGCKLLLTEGADSVAKSLAAWQGLSAKARSRASNPVAKPLRHFREISGVVHPEVFGAPEQLGLDF